MNIEFYRLIGSLETIIHFINSQYHDVESGEHGAESKLPEDDRRAGEPIEVESQLKVLRDVITELLREHAKISHAFFDFRRALSRNAEAFYHAINKLRRKAPEWQILDEDLLQLIENYQATASNMFFGGDGEGSKNPGGSGSGSGSPLR